MTTTPSRHLQLVASGDRLRPRPPAPPVWCPFDLHLDTIGRLCNAEFVDHPVYDGIELQWFDDATHGTGLLAFLSRRADRTVDYYHAPQLRLDPADYRIGAGIGAWRETDFEVARLEVGPDGTVVDVRFCDVDGRRIEVAVDDRDARRRDGEAVLLAPVGADIERPSSLMLVLLHGFDLVHETATPPRFRIDGEAVATGTLPGRALHHRHLVKAAAPVVVAHVNRDGGSGVVEASEVELSPAREIHRLRADAAGHHAELRFRPPVPDLQTLPSGAVAAGRWEVAVDDAVVTGGTWRIASRGDELGAELDVTRPWRPGRLPALVRTVTTVLPVFRRWPTTYRWRGTFLAVGAPLVLGRWERTGDAGTRRYARSTGHR